MDPTSFWTVPDRTPQRTGCIVVLSYAVESASHPTKPTIAILDRAVSLRRTHARARIIVSTGDNQGLGVTNAHVMAGYLRKHRIPAAAILEEGQSRDTYENLLYSMELAAKHGLKDVTIVTYDLHARRARAIARRLGLDGTAWLSAGGPGSPAYGVKALQTYSRLTILIYELLAYVYNRLKGQI